MMQIIKNTKKRLFGGVIALLIVVTYNNTLAQVCNRTAAENAIITAFANNPLVSCPGACDASWSIAAYGSDGHTFPYNFSIYLNGVWQGDGAASGPFMASTGFTSLSSLCEGDVIILSTCTSNGKHDNETYTVGQQPTGIPNAPIISPSGSVYTCNGSTVTLTASESADGNEDWTTSMSYQWTLGGADYGASALLSGAPAPDDLVVTATGVYNVVIDNGCTITDAASVTVTDITLTASAVTTTAVSCFGNCDGEGEVTPSGWTGYAYEWDNPSSQNTSTANGLCCATTYTVTVTAAGTTCSVTDNVSLTCPPSNITPSLTINSHETCTNSSDGSITASAVGGGGGPYNFTWSTGSGPTSGMTDIQNNLTAGAIIVTVDEGTACISTITETITVSPAITINESSTDETCGGYNDGTASTAPTGGNGSPYGYSWSSGPSTQNITGLAPGSYTVTVSNTGAPASCQQTASVTVNAAELITVTNSIAQVTCTTDNNGAVTITASGGTTPLTYEWSANAGGGTGTINGSNENLTNLACNDTYTITVTDVNNCTVSNASNLVCPPDLTVTTSITPPTCPGIDDGTATAIVSGGTTPYIYLWSDGANQTTQTATGLAGTVAGITYNVTVNPGSACSVTASVSEIAPSPFTINMTVTPETCPGSCDGTAASTITGGTGPDFDFEWSTTASDIAVTNSNITSLCAANYSLTVTDNGTGCNDVEPFTVTTSPSVTITSTVTDPTCSAADGAIDITATGGQTPYTYSWSTGAGTEDINSLDCTGNPYGVTVTPNGNAACAVTATNTLVCPTPVTITDDGQTDPTCFGFTDGSISITASGGNGVYTYDWDNDGTGDNDDTQDQLSLGNGVYNVTVSSAGCTETASYTITQPLAVTATAVIDNEPLCNGSSDGQASVTGSGGTSPYSFLWSNSQTTQTVTGLSGGVLSVTVSDFNSCQGVDQITLTPPTAVTATASLDNDPTCNGGTDGQASVVGTGGTVAVDYTYSWSPGGQATATATGLSAGVYSITVTDDNNCTGTDQVTLTNPPSITATASVNTNPLCNNSSDGEVTVVGTGGTVAVDYTYLWSPGGQATATATGLSAGAYTVTVFDDNMCQGTDQVTLTPPNAVTATASVDNNVLCNGDATGQATVVGTGGTVAIDYGYLWNDGATQITATATGLAVGVYTVTVTDDNGCTDTDQVTITEPTAVTATASIDNNVSCNAGSDGQATAVGSGGTITVDYTYNWNPSGQNTATATGLSVGVYDVTVTDDNGCTDADQMTITEPSAITVSTTVTHVNCAGESTGEVSAIVSGGASGYTYSWSGGAAAAQTTATVTGLTDGSYTVTVSDANACSTTATDNVTISNPLLVTTTSTDILCAGDANGTATLSVSGGNPNYSFNWGGAGLNPSDVNVTVTTNSGLSAGSYNVTITDASACTEIETVVINTVTPLNVVNSITNIDCNGGTTGAIGLIVSGGTTNYSYNWSNGETTFGITGLAAGTYSYTVTDANACTDMATLTVTESTALTVTAISNDATCGVTPCNGGVSVTSVNGGTTPYSYLWSSGGTTASETGLCGASYTVTITDGINCSVTESRVVNSVGGGSITITSVTAETCIGDSDGTMDAVASGGTTPYTYQWLDGSLSPIAGQTTTSISGLTGGTYTISITDANGCTGSDDDIVTPGVDISVTETIVNVACLGESTGSITLVSAGSSPYLYNWNNSETTSGISGLATGTYSVTVEAPSSGCLDAFSYTITEPLTAVDASNTNSSDITCNGLSDGTASVSPSGGTIGSGYSYLWSNGRTTQAITGLSAGFYTVTVFDGNLCSDVSPVITITEPTAITVTTVTSSYNGFEVSCDGATDGAITVTATGGNTPLAYQWDAGAGLATTTTVTGLGAGTYSVSITAQFGTCEEVRTITLTAPAALTLTTTVTDPLCNGDANGTATAVASGGITNYSYAWDVAAASQTSATATGLAGGAYTVTLTDANGCSSITSATLTPPAVLGASTAIVSNYNGEDITCNGSSDAIISVTESGGTSPYTYLWSNAEVTAEISGLGAGTYDVTVTDNNGCIITATETVSEPTSITVTTSVTNSNCGVADGEVTTTVTGGTLGTGYSYLWSSSPVQNTSTATGLVAGSYGLTVSDGNNCVATTISDVNDDGAEIITVTNTTVTCYNDCDGILSVTSPGGAPDPCDDGPCNALWSDGQTSYVATGLCPGTYTVTITNASGCRSIETAEVFNTDSIQAGETITHVACFGSSTGAITTNASGGRATTYDYLWGGSETTADINGLVAATYTLTITDQSAFNCSQEYSFDVTATPALTVSETVTDVLCNGGNTGAIDVTVTGGTSPYTYSWDNAATSEDLSSLMAGTYVLTVTDANLCTDNITATVNENSAITITGTPTTNVACFGESTGAITVTASGGVTPYTYLWDDPSGQTTVAATGLAAGVYNVSVQSNVTVTCQTAETITVSQPLGTLTISTASTDVSCNLGNDGSVTVTASGATTPYSYAWSSGGTADVTSGLSAGTVIVTVTDGNGCSDIENTTVTEPTAIVVNYVMQPTPCTLTDGGITVTPSGGTGTAYTYVWDGGTISGTTMITGQTTQAVTGLASDSYDVTVTDENGCSIVEAGIVVTATDGPVISIDNITSPSCVGEDDGSIDISVTGGDSPYNYWWNPAPGGGALSEDATGVEEGVYIIRVDDASGCLAVENVTVTEPEAMVATYVEVEPSCGDCNGELTISVTGGSSPYSYLWSSGGNTNASTGLCAGLYEIDVVDQNGCSQTFNTGLSNNDGPTDYTITLTSPSCFGAGNASAEITSVIGGASPYSYLWFPNGTQTTALATGLDVESYTIEITDANDCKLVVDTAITEPFQLTDSISQTPTTCGGSDGTLSIFVSGGVFPYSYQWNNSETTNSLTGLAEGALRLTVTDNDGCQETFSYFISGSTAANVTVSGTDVLCTGDSNGSATSGASGGTTPYSFEWFDVATSTSLGVTSQSITGLAPGEYEIRVNDGAGCLSAAQVEIEDQNPITFSTPVVSDVSCFGQSDGTISSIVVGGTFPYSYSWSNSDNTSTIQNLTADRYYLTLTDANGCIDIDSIDVIEPTQLVVDTVETNSLYCSTGADAYFDLEVSGGESPYTYLWTGGMTTQDISGLAAGTYEVTVTDASGCEEIRTYIVGGPALSITTTDVSCSGGNDGSADLTATGANTPFTYLWNPPPGVGSQTNEDAFGLSTGVIMVQVTDTLGCESSITATVNEATPLSVTFTEIQSTCGDCNGELTANVSGGSGVYNYVWSNNGTNATETGLCAGAYELIVTDDNGCSETFITGLSNVGGPTDHMFSVSNASCYGMNDATASITVTGGQTPYSYEWLPTGQETQTATGLEVRSYTAIVTDANGCILTADTAISEPFQIVDSLSQSPTTCGGSDGTIDVFISGGVSPYSYAWSGGETTTSLTGLPEGVIKLTVTDGTACTEEFTYAINGSNAPSITLTANDVLCYGGSTGSVSSQLNGGISPYNYIWYDATTTIATGVSTVSGLPVGTYMLQVQDNTTPTGCSAFAQIDIEQPDSVQFSTPVGVNPTCFDASDGVTTVVPVGGTLPYSFEWNSGQTTASAAGLSGGTYYLTLTDANGCMNADSVTIIAPDTIRIDTTAGTVFCDPNGGDLIMAITGGTGTNYTYQWSNGRTTKDITGLNPGTYCITVTDEIGCINTECFTIGGPVINNAFGIPASCNGEEGSGFISVSGGETPYTYTWNPGGLTGSTPDLFAGVYSITVTDAAGCESVNIMGITVTEPDTLTATFNTVDATCGAAQCDGSATAIISGGTSPYTYLWGSGETNITDDNICGGTHRVDITDDNGCAATFFVGLSDIGGPDSVDFIQTDVTCFDDEDGTAEITNVYGGTSPYNYDWTGNPTGDGTPVVTGLAIGQYFVNISDQNNCILNQEINIGGPAQIVDSPDIYSTECNENNGAIYANISGGAGTPYSYAWNIAGVTSSQTGLATGQYALTVTDPAGCTAEFDYNLNPSGTLILVTSLTDATCFGTSTGSIAISVSGGNSPYTYLWANGQTSAIAVGLPAGDHTVTITDNGNCISNTTETIEEPNELELSSESLSNISCNSLTDGSITLDYIGGTIPYAYNWDIPATGANVANLAAGVYTATVTDANSCTAIYTTTITEPDLINIDTLDVMPSLCDHDSTGSVNVTVTGGTKPYSYLWSEGSTTEDVSGLSIGAYTLTVSDFRNCTSTYSVAVTDSLQMTIINLTDTAVCENVSEVELNAMASLTPAGSILTLAWLEGTDTLSTVDSVIVVPTVGDNSYTFVATHNGCSWDTTITLTVNTLPDVDAGEDVEMILNGTREIGGDPTSLTGVSFDWSPATYIDDTTLANPEINPELDGTFTYYVDVTDDNGCVNTDSVTIVVIPEVDIVDIFTPNGDGINDTWEVPFLDQYPDAEVEIYNRWGELLYKITGGYTIPWDATYNGTPVPIGTYYYIITLNHPDADEPITGPLSVVR